VEPISFARGVPSADLLPLEEIEACTNAVLSRDAHRLLLYGPATGYEPLRSGIAERHEVEPARVIVTNGSLQGIVFLATHLLAVRPRRVLVEAPAYDRTLKALARLRAEIVPIRVDDDGLDVDSLERVLENAPPAAFFYTIPTFQNPTGTTLSLPRRLRLAELVRRHGLLVVEDDPYADLRFEGTPLPSLFELLEGEGVVYSSSFSKTIAPGLRAGYLVLPREIAGSIAALAASTYVAPAVVLQAIVSEFLARGHLEPTLRRVRPRLRARRDAMLAALAEHLPVAAWSRPSGGYFVWLTLPRGVDAALLAERAATLGVAFVPGCDFGGPENSARLAFSAVAPGEIHDGAARLGEALHSLPRRRLREAA
jgi:DNA-binding transcriptional MocR family regulator